MQHETRPSIDEFARVSHMIAGALAASVPLYMVIAVFTAPSMAPDGGDAQLIQLLAIVFGALSAVHLAGAQVFIQVLLGKARQKSGAEERLAGYRRAVIIGFVLREGVALYGLVLSFLSGDPKWALGFGAVALFSMVVGWPKRSVMEELVSEIPLIV